MNKQILLISIRSKGDKEVTRALAAMNGELTKSSALSKVLSAVSSKYNAIIDKQSAIIKKATKALKKKSVVTKKAVSETRRLRQASIGAGLSLMFMGMAMKRFGSAALRGLFSVYDNFDNGTTQMQSSILGLRASFEFLKFSIVNALEGTVIERFVIWVTESFVKLADYFGNNPDFAVKLTALFTGLFAIGTGAALYGQVWLFTNAFTGLFAEKGALAAGIKGDAITTKFGKIMDGLNKAAGIMLFFDTIEELLEGDFIGMAASAMRSISYFTSRVVGKSFGSVGIALSIVEMNSKGDILSAANIVDHVLNTGLAIKIFGVKGGLIYLGIIATISLDQRFNIGDKIKKMMKNIKTSLNPFSSTDTSSITSSVADIFSKDYGTTPFEILEQDGVKFNKFSKEFKEEYNISMDSTMNATNNFRDAVAGDNESLYNAFGTVSEQIDTVLIPKFVGFDTQEMINIATTNQFYEAVNSTIRTTYSTHIHTIITRRRSESD